MAAPTTVEEYLRQIPNPAPCPHSATTTDPPCHACIERRITTATALRAGQDPSVALGLASNEIAQQGIATVGAPPEPGTPLGVAQEGVEAETAMDALLAAAPPIPEPVEIELGEEVNPDDFDDEGFPLSQAEKDARAAAAAPTPQLETPVPDDAFLPGMTHTPPEPIQPQQAPDPAALLAQMTGGAVEAPAITTTPPQMVTEGLTTRPLAPLELSPEQMQRRNEIEAGVHPAVAPVEQIAPAIEPAPDIVPRSTLLGYAQKGYEPGEQIVWPGPPPVGLPVGEPLTTGQALMVNAATGLVVVYVEPTEAVPPEMTPPPAAVVPVGTPDPAHPEFLKTARNSQGQLYGWTGTDWTLIDETQPEREAPGEGVAAEAGPGEAAAPTPEPQDRPKLHPAGHRDALIKYVKAHWPATAPDKDNVSYIVIDLLDGLRERLDEQMHRLVTDPKPIEQAIPVMDAAAHQAVDAAQAQEAATQPTAAPTEPQAAPVADNPIAAAAAVAAPVQVDPSALATTCPHGMPGTDFSTNPPRSASCPSCMMDGGPPPALSKLVAERFQLAHLQTTCARTMCNRTIEPGQIIGLVPQVGWCCAVCTKPDRPTVPTA